MTRGSTRLFRPTGLTYTMLTSTATLLQQRGWALWAGPVGNHYARSCCAPSHKRMFGFMDMLMLARVNWPTIRRQTLFAYDARLLPSKAQEQLLKVSAGITITKPSEQTKIFG